MKNAPLLTVVALGAGIGWLAPSLHLAGQAEEPSTALAEGADGGTDKPSGWYGDEVSLVREADGHFYATVSAEMRDYRMLVDTGATVVALTGADADDMGLDWDPDALSVVGRGASGDVHGVPVTIPRLRLGEFEVAQVQAVIIPEGLDVSLLGQSFLGKLSTVEIRGDSMVLGG